MTHEAEDLALAAIKADIVSAWNARVGDEGFSIDEMNEFIDRAYALGQASHSRVVEWDVERVARALWEDWRQGRSAKQTDRDTSWEQLVTGAADSASLRDMVADGHSQARAAIVAMAPDPATTQATAIAALVEISQRHSAASVDGDIARRGLGIPRDPSAAAIEPEPATASPPKDTVTDWRHVPSLQAVVLDHFKTKHDQPVRTQREDEVWSRAISAIWHANSETKAYEAERAVEALSHAHLLAGPVVITREEALRIGMDFFNAMHRTRMRGMDTSIFAVEALRSVLGSRITVEGEKS